MLSTSQKSISSGSGYFYFWDSTKRYVSLLQKKIYWIWEKREKHYLHQDQKYNVKNYVSGTVSLWSRLQFGSVAPCLSVTATNMIYCDSLRVIRLLLNLSISLTVRKVKYTQNLHLLFYFFQIRLRCLFQQWSVSIDLILSWQHFHYLGIRYALDSLAHFDFWTQTFMPFCGILQLYHPLTITIDYNYWFVAYVSALETLLLAFPWEWRLLFSSSVCKFRILLGLLSH